MKIASYFLLFGALFLSCSSSKTDVPADLLYDCMNASFEEQGYQLPDEIKALEVELIAQGILANGTPTSVYKAFEQLAADDLPSFTLDPKKHPALFNIRPQQYISQNCRDSVFVMASEHPKSKVYALEKAMNELTASGEISAQAIAKKELSILEKEDLNHCYYHFSLMLQLVYVADIETGLALPDLD